MNIAENLELLATTKESIRQSINSKGGNLTLQDPFSAYSAAIDALIVVTPPVKSAFYFENNLLEEAEVTTLASSAFTESIAGADKLVVGENVTTIPDEAFNNEQMSLYDMRIIDFSHVTGLTYIGENAFTSSTAITSNETGTPILTIPEGVTYIGSSAFGSQQMINVDLPSTLEEIGMYTFSAKVVACRALTPPTNFDSAFFVMNNATIYVPDESVELYPSIGGATIAPLSQLQWAEPNN